ncbi:protein kinase domain-containing protein [Oribacterium sp. FC2011]|uniref:protein kinase domain-containing protein n=1 Tax=Oribacterium sp. FC2011 TaxID=1408311 RepID=UPI00067883E2|nr:protein kinase [Oribacterium sp. FC2011]
MENSYYKGLEPFWGEWYIDKLIGEGSFGKVFRIIRNTSSGQEEAALKAITIPQNNSEYSEMLSYESDEHTVNAYFKDAVMNLNKETLLMAALRGNKNIVEYQDHVVNEHKNEVGWDILIRMELLTSLTNLLRERNLKRDEVVKLGIDICNALTACQKYGIIHRDIKPANIFIDKNGNYKLGDFGVSRAMEKTQGFMSKKGTYSFMAPEVYKGESYGVAADIYSLGMVMYFLMNARKIPFQPFESNGISFRVREECLNRRMSGERIPAPTFADKALAEIILKACEFNQENRYHSAKEMADDLSKLIIVNQKQDEHTWESSHIESRKENRPEAQSVSTENIDNLNAVQEKHEGQIKSGELVNREEPEKPEEIIDYDSDSDRTIAMFETLPLSHNSDVKSQDQYTKPVEKVADTVIENKTEIAPEFEKKMEDDTPKRDPAPKKEMKKTTFGILIAIAVLIIAAVCINGKTESTFDQALEYYSKEDYTKAKELFDKAAEGGSADAMYIIGFMYQNGEGVDQDYAKAKEWYTKAAEGGNTEAMTKLGLLYYFGNGVTQDYTKTKEWYEKAIESGSTDAMMLLGEMYQNGEGVDQDYAKAKEWYTKAAEGGNTAAMNCLGEIYEYGYGVDQDYSKAKEWFEKAVEGGNTAAMLNLGIQYFVDQDYAKAKELFEKSAEGEDTSAMFMLGFMYSEGNGVDQDYTKAKEWYEKAVEGGHAGAMNELGVMYKNGEGVDQDYTKAIELYEKAAEVGNTDAMNNLGRMYVRGEGVSQDYAKAKEWYEKAVEGGDAAAMNELGVMYENGEGVDQDYTKAIELYEKAAEVGNTNAMYNLGVMYVRGEGVSQDYAKAKEWYEKAAEGGDADAMNNLGYMYLNGLGVDRDYTKAKELFEKTAEGGNTLAMDNLGYMYENGLGVEKDAAKAKEWYEKAAEGGDADAINNLGYMYLNGLGVDRDYTKAKELFEKAAEGGNTLAMDNLGYMYENGLGVEKDAAKAKEWHQKAAAASGS